MKRMLYKLTKRVIDVTASLCALMLLSPLLVILALLIRKDGGPVFYSQERIGLHGERFRMWKFRSMRVDADEIRERLLHQSDFDGPMFKMKDDPRVTEIGRFIRKHSIDEIPQFFNVIMGHMSLVGPRPALPVEYAEYCHEEASRLFTLPGITGLWQVSGRSDLSFKEMIELDKKYIESQSLLIDIKIMFKTVWVMFDERASGAY
ncbi:sugar transferase [Weissella cibaria]|uniref:sugar transferase n=1 Tax=Weissella cibaria TaxID=137591 RepID=UPI001194702D|nr:sugar transferase [Weissella cibaria]MCT8398478.1 sugar transferase [Weissella cibaria]MCT8401675.1 sugar transferase [Weissella cibaria]TVV25968.1 sugar transferase [Weissella cibaria]